MPRPGEPMSRSTHAPACACRFIQSPCAQTTARCRCGSSCCTKFLINHSFCSQSYFQPWCPPSSLRYPGVCAEVGMALPPLCGLVFFCGTFWNQTGFPHPESSVTASSEVCGLGKRRLPGSPCQSPTSDVCLQHEQVVPWGWAGNAESPLTPDGDRERF